MAKILVLFLWLLVPSVVFAQGITQLSGNVVDTSGAVIAGATVQVRSANGTVQITTQSDANGSFIISGLSAGNYRLVVSNPGFETKEVPVTIGTTKAVSYTHLDVYKRQDTRVLRPAYAALRSQVPQQLFLQHSACLDEQAAVNRFVGHAHALVIGIPDLQPSRNLFRRAIQNQFTRNNLPQLHMDGQKAPLGPQGRVPSSLIRFLGSILRTAAMTCYLPAHRRRGTL